MKLDLLSLLREAIMKYFSTAFSKPRLLSSALVKMTRGYKLHSDPSTSLHVYLTLRFSIG